MYEIRRQHIQKINILRQIPTRRLRGIQLAANVNWRIYAIDSLKMTCLECFYFKPSRARYLLFSMMNLYEVKYEINS
jgi:hypothetical protein